MNDQFYRQLQPAISQLQAGFGPSGFLSCNQLPCITLDQRGAGHPPLGPYELVVERIGDKITLDYGSELRLLIADPFAGIDLRTAIQQLKEALSERKLK
jgi:hypothetical protein